MKIAKVALVLMMLASDVDASHKETKAGVVIVGGGAAGTYLAWRMATAEDSDYDPSDIHLYERTDHISGRLYSPTIGEDLCTADGETDDSHLPRTELGGMRIRKGLDNLALGVVDQLGIETAPFYMNAEDTTQSSSITNPAYARNTLGTFGDFVVGGNKIPFTQGPPFGGDSTNPYVPPFQELIKEGINETSFDPCDGKENSKVFYQPFGPEGQPMYTYSNDELTKTFGPVGFGGATEEDYSFFELLSGYSLAGFDFGAGSPEFAGVLSHSFDEYVRPLEGMQSLPHALHDAAVEEGVKSFVNVEVTKLELLKQGDWLVTTRETITSPCSGITIMKNNGNKMKTVRAEKVVLALPAAALRRIQIVTPRENGKLKRTVDSLSVQATGIPLMKLFAAYPYRWWNTVNHLDTFSEDEYPEYIPPGRNTTFEAGMFKNDVTSHIFSWYPGTQSRPETVAANAPACSDMGVIQYYSMPGKINKYGPAAQYEDQAECVYKNKEDTCAACNPDTNDDWFSQGISKRLHDMVKSDMSTIFRTNAPFPSEIKYRIWHGDDPVTRSDAVHFWKSGVEWWKSYKQALNLKSGKKQYNLHMIGEIFSHNQGWAEGAFETAEHLLQEVWGMDRPSWLSRKDYCKSMPFYSRRKSS